MFDFNNQKKKDKYYDRAQRFLEEQELRCFEIDRAQFGVKQNTYARIDLLPFTKKTVNRHELAKAKELKPFVVVMDRYTKVQHMQGLPLREKAYLLFELDAEDR